MCGRYAQAVDPSDLAYEFDKSHLQIDELQETENAHPGYNIGPTQNAPVYFFTADPSYHENVKHVVRYMKWGLIPFWEAGNKEKNKSAGWKTFNAKLESIEDGSRLWKSVRSKQRCVVPIQGYYEWKTTDKRKKPYYITRKDGKLMYMAGMYSVCKDSEDDKLISSYTIITGPAPKEFEWLHKRMPIVLDPGTKEFEDWLDPKLDSWNKRLAQCLNPYSSNELQTYPVSQDVGNVRNEGEYLIQPIKEEDKDVEVKDEHGGIKKWFTSAKQEHTVKEGDNDNKHGIKKEEPDEDDIIEIKDKPSASPTSSSADASKSPPLKYTPIKKKSSPPKSLSPVKSPKKEKRQSTLDDMLSPKKRKI